MKKVRQRRKDAGLVEFRTWVHPDDKPAIEELAKELNRARSIVIANRLYNPVIEELDLL